MHSFSGEVGTKLLPGQTTDRQPRELSARTNYGRVLATSRATRDAARLLAQVTQGEAFMPLDRLVETGP